MAKRATADDYEDEVNALAERMFALAAPNWRSSGKTLEFLAQDCFEAARVFMAHRKAFWAKRATPAVENKAAPTE